VKHAGPPGCNLRHHGRQQTAGGPNRQKSSQPLSQSPAITSISSTIWQFASCITGKLASSASASISSIRSRLRSRPRVDNIRAAGEHPITANPDAEAAVEAIARFVETSGRTLVIKLTPRGKVPAMQLVQVLQMDPLTALAQFRIEASTGL
jgi:hypothetical protein